MTVAAPFVCPRCHAPLELAEITRCRCGAVYPSHFGIPDLRVGLRTAAGDFPVADDLREAGEVDAEFMGRTYVEWLAYREERAAVEPDPARRALIQRWFAGERRMFGVHGPAILEKIDAFLSARDPKRWERWRREARVALEAGCGTGQHPIGFASRFETVLVTDISYVSLVQARKIALELDLRNVVVFASNIEALPIADDSLDFIHCNEVIEHVDRPDVVIDEAVRTLSEPGLAMILSPNRFTIWVEPHAHVAAYAFWPRPARRWMQRRVKGDSDMSHTDLRSLRQIRRYARDFGRSYIYMLPPRLPSVATGGLLRRTIRAALNGRVTGRIADWAINRALLAVMPYHVLIGFKRR